MKRVASKTIFCLIFEIVLLYGAIYVGFAQQPKGLELFFLLPLTFCLAFPILFKVSIESKNSLFFIAFSVIAFLRYFVAPLLHTATGDYYGPRIVTSIGVESWRTGVLLMVYELLVTTIVMFIIYKKMKSKANPKKNNYILVEKNFVYNALFAVTALFVLIRPTALSYFSFLNIGMSGVDVSGIGLLSQITVMLLISSKLLAFPVLISFLKKKWMSSKNKWFYEMLAFLLTMVSGAIYYGGNRAQFLFSMIYSVYIYVALFPKNKKIVVTMSLILGLFILVFMTEERNYQDVYADVSGLKGYALDFLDTINQYFGGITNVATSVEMKAEYVSRQNISQLIKDCLVPIVGVNKLIPFDDTIISNTIFNYVFFESTRNVTQILPSIGHGYFIFGFALAPLLDVIQLYIAFKLYEGLNKSMRIEIIYLFNIVLMRFSLMYGQNITQQINGMSMQLMLPIVVYMFNKEIRLFSRKKLCKKH